MKKRWNNLETPSKHTENTPVKQHQNTLEYPENIQRNNLDTGHTLKTLNKHPFNICKHPWNVDKIPIKYPWNTHETTLNHPLNIHDTTLKTPWPLAYNLLLLLTIWIVFLKIHQYPSILKLFSFDFNFSKLKWS